ncbi:MAG TPA: glycosyltransferase family 4 protein [Spirochaetota bacterium]|nr:glycosyltransferase family 4 protein [Spirochaetota bacterium]
MRILVAHNYYGNKVTGGESIVFKNEVDLLSKNGFNVLTYERSNSELNDRDLASKLRAVYNIHWSDETIREAGRLMDDFKPDILHVHNYKFLITPSIFSAAKQRGIKTVLTIHNYRLMVPCGNFMTRRGAVCERCLDRNPVNILLRRCSEGSLGKSYLQYRLFVKTKYGLNQLAELVDAYIVLTEFSSLKLRLTGVPNEKIIVKPNFVTSYSDMPNLVREKRAVYVGRLSYEKGCLELIRNWEGINFPLVIIGDGVLTERAKSLAINNPLISFMGDMDNDHVKKFVGESTFLVFPSTVYEGMPLTILEAMSVGTPVLATDLGPRKDIVLDGQTGLLYIPSNSEDFKNKVMQLVSRSDIATSMGIAARKEYERRYSPEINLRMLSDIYNSVLG